LNGSIKPPGGENGRDREASTFLAVMIQGTSSYRADSFPGWPNACWCSFSDLSLWVDGADQQRSVVT